MRPHFLFFFFLACLFLCLMTVPSKSHSFLYSHWWGLVFIWQFSICSDVRIPQSHLRMLINRYRNKRVGTIKTLQSWAKELEGNEWQCSGTWLPTAMDGISWVFIDWCEWVQCLYFSLKWKGGGPFDPLTVFGWCSLTSKHRLCCVLLCLLEGCGLFSELMLQM